MPEITIRAADGNTTRFALEKERVTIGRSRENDIFLPDQWLSRQHAAIRRDAGGFVLVDLGSKNGTLVNGAVIKDDRVLHDGDVITLGEHLLTYKDTRPVLEHEPELLGTRVFSARELTSVSSEPSHEAAEIARQNRVLGILSAGELLLHRPLTELFDLILKMLFEAVPAERGAILLLEGQPVALQVKASRARSGGSDVKVSRSIARRVVDDRVSVLIPNVLDDAAFREQESIVATGIRSAVCAPLWLGVSGQDEVIGLVYLDSLRGTHTFSEQDLRIVTALASVAAAKIENARLLEDRLEKQRLEEEMRVAAEIQRWLMPKAAPQVPGYCLVGSNKPCRTIGGDYYDFDVENGQLLLALGDVSGKGTGAALLMTVLRAATRGHWTEGTPAEAVGRINRTVAQNVPNGKYITFFMARLDPATGRIAYVNAGHNPPLLIRTDGSVETLTEGGMVLGLFESVPYADGVIDLRPGDALIIFSDGVTETWSPQDEEFGDDGLKNIAVEHRRCDVATLQDHILQALERHAAGGKATDDRTLVVLKRD
jgi:sigma-B regulation protein RsbU (phosphoserine phosphatase)